MSDFSPEARGLLDAARDGDEMPRADKTRHRKQLLAQVAIASAVGAGATLVAKGAAANGVAIAGAGAGTATVTAVGAIAGTSLLTKVAAVFVMVGVVGGGAVGVSSLGRDRSTPSAPAPTAVAPARVESASNQIKPQTPLEVSAPTPVLEAQPEQLPAAPPARSAKASSAVTPSAPTEPEPKPRKSSLESETLLLRHAHEMLQAGNASRALSLLDEHARSYPHGALVEERGAQRIFALCALGSTARARSEAAIFLSERPNSPLAPRVRTSCIAK